MSAGVAVSLAVCVCVDLSVNVSLRMSVGVSVRALVEVPVGDRGFPWYVVDAAVDIAVDAAVARATRLHGVAVPTAAFGGNPWNVRGIPSHPTVGAALSAPKRPWAIEFLM